MKKSLDRSRTTKLEEDWNVHRDNQRAYTRAIRTSKRESWRKFTESIEGTHPTARVVKLLKRDISVQLNAVHNGDKFTSSPEETLETMLDHHVPRADDGDSTPDKVPTAFPMGWGSRSGNC